MSDESFLGRWSRRKQAPPEAIEAEDVRIARELAEAQAASAAVPAAEERNPQAVAPPPDLPSIDSLTPDADFRPFMQPDVPPQLKNAALKKLFSDPHFNVMDGLDTYIDDYTREDPIPEAMLRSLVQSRTLKLFDYSKEEAEEAAEKLARERAGRREQGSAPDEAAATPASVAALPEAGPVPPLTAREPDASEASVVRIPDPDGASRQ
jgi:hypothetical protein